MSFPRYPKYKDSGVEWLREVPQDWDIMPMKYVASLKGRLGWQNLRADEYTDEGPFLVTSEHLSNDRVDWDRCYHVSEERYAMAPEIQLRPGDLMMMKDGAAMGKLGYIDQLPGRACLNSHLLLFRPRDARVTNRFLYYVLGSPSFKTYMLQERTGSTFFGISQESIGSFYMAVPPAASLRSIVAFLDHETAKIDALVAEQQRLIELLKEKRRTVIMHAVTKGLNPDVSMRPSGVEWLGDVPAHWEVVQSRRLFGLRKEGALPSDRQLTASQKYGVIYQEDFMAMEGQRVVQVLKGADILKHVEPNDFVISMRSFQGRIEWCKYRGCTSSAYVILVPTARVHCGCFSYALKSDTYIQALQTTSNLVRDGQALRYENFSQVALPLLPHDEQERIASFLDRETAKVDALTAEAERAIALLQERRTALISAAVTGKIDVRGLVGDEAVAA